MWCRLGSRFCAGSLWHWDMSSYLNNPHPENLQTCRDGGFSLIPLLMQPSVVSEILFLFLYVLVSFWGYVCLLCIIVFLQWHQVFRQRLWMRHFGVGSWKETILWSNSHYISLLDHGPLTKQMRQTSTPLASTYVDARGVKRCVGKKKILKQSQWLVWNVAILHFMHMENQKWNIYIWYIFWFPEKKKETKNVTPSIRYIYICLDIIIKYHTYTMKAYIYTHIFGFPNKNIWLVSVWRWGLTQKHLGTALHHSSTKSTMVYGAWGNRRTEWENFVLVEIDVFFRCRMLKVFLSFFIFQLKSAGPGTWYKRLDPWRHYSRHDDEWARSVVWCGYVISYLLSTSKQIFKCSSWTTVHFGDEQVKGLHSSNLTIIYTKCLFQIFGRLVL